MNISIKTRIYLSFSFLVTLFIINGIITLFVLHNTRKASRHISAVADPSIEALHELRKVMRESNMYTTNWIFIRSDGEDKNTLIDLQNSVYPAIKKELLALSSNWFDKPMEDSLKNVLTGFDQVITEERSIMGLLQKFSDYNDPSRKFEAEEKLESIVLPRTLSLSISLNKILNYEKDIKVKEAKKLHSAYTFLRKLITSLAIGIVFLGIFLSIYLGRNIIKPINAIREIINDLGKGIIRKVRFNGKADEIGEMIHSVNNLALKLEGTASFAHEVGIRNFDMPFQPLGEEDTLGKALLAMRDNLKVGEHELAGKNKELELKNKELEQFAYVASHDLQEPLRTTSSFVDLLQQQYQGQLDEKADKYLTYIQQSSDRMKVLINDLLDYSRIGNKKKLEPVDCNTVVAEVLADLGKAITDQHSMIHTEKLPVISGYRTEIKQLFQNLVINAIKFCKKGGFPFINISAKKTHANWTFTVRDNGIGIDEAHKERIFIIFQRLHTRSEYEGSGIGLAHCKKIVGLHGGKIWVDSKLGEGSAFHFNIPNINN